MPFTLPYKKITAIPDTEPDAIPSLWNERYDEIDENFKRVAEFTGCGICETPGDNPDKAVSCDFFALKDLCSVKVVFTSTNTAETPCLNVNNTGSKPIIAEGKAVPKSFIVAGRVYEFCYYGGSWVACGGTNVSSDGSMTIEGGMNANYANFNTASIAGEMSAGSMTVSGQINAGSIVSDSATFSGNITTADPVEPQHAATKEYADNGDRFGRAVYSAFAAFNAEKNIA